MKVKLVTGYVRLDLPASHRTDEDYKRLSPRLLSVPVPIRAFVNYPLEECWLSKYLDGRPGVTHSTEDNPNKNTLAYMTVLAQKTEWLRMAAAEDPDVEVFVWADYGIFHQPGHSEQAIVDLMQRVDDTAIAIPGIYEQGPIDDNVACWRFCGSMFVCPRKFLDDFDGAIKIQVLYSLLKYNYVTWDVNNWAHVEQQDGLPIRWYKAGHDGSLFTNY